jgi:hypothetical protein
MREVFLLCSEEDEGDSASSQFPQQGFDQPCAQTKATIQWMDVVPEQHRRAALLPEGDTTDNLFSQDGHVHPSTGRNVRGRVSVLRGKITRETPPEFGAHCLQ